MFTCTCFFDGLDDTSLSKSGYDYLFAIFSVSKNRKFFFDVSMSVGFSVVDLKLIEIVLTSRFGSLINSSKIVDVK